MERVAQEEGGAGPGAGSAARKPPSPAVCSHYRVTRTPRVRYELCGPRPLPSGDTGDSDQAGQHPLFLEQPLPHGSAQQTMCKISTSVKLQRIVLRL